MDVRAEEIKADLLSALESDQLVLPTLPEIALQVREAASDPDTDIKRLHDLLASDAALSARVVRVANSPLVRGHQKIEHLQAALSRLGVKYSCNLVVGLAMEQIFQATNELIDQRLREAWAVSTEVAAISTVLAQHFTNLEADKATLAGLTHQIGVLPVLSYLEENADRITVSAEDMDQIIAAISPDLGCRILRSWDFEDDLAQVPAEHQNYTRDSESIDYVDVVMVAWLQSQGEELEAGTVPERSQIPAFKKLGLATEEESLDMGPLVEEIDMAMSVLQQ